MQTVFWKRCETANEYLKIKKRRVCVRTAFTNSVYTKSRAEMW